VAVPEPVVQPAEGNDAIERLLVTLACAAGILVLSHLSAFGLPRGVLGDDEVAVPLLPLGLLPFVTAFVLVELVALLLPGLRAARVGGAERRRGLDRTAWVLGAALLAIQLFNHERTVEAVLALRTPWTPWLLWAQWLLAEGLMLWLVLVVARRGLGGGWSILLTADTTSDLVRWAGTAYRALANDTVSVGAVLLPATLVIGVTLWAVRLSRGSRSFGPSRPSAAPFPVSGTGAWVVGGVFVSLPSTFGWGALADALMHSQVLTVAAVAFFAFGQTLVLGVLFFRPAAVAELWSRWGHQVQQGTVSAEARALLPRALLLSLAVLVGAPLALVVLDGFFPSATPFPMDAMVLGLVLVDLVDEFGAIRRLGPLVSVWSLQRTAEVEPLVRALGERGIEAFPRAFGARTTQQFFAPWMPIGVLVPQAQEAAARAFISRTREIDMLAGA
jgi:hypothetical protein